MTVLEFGVWIQAGFVKYSDHGNVYDLFGDRVSGVARSTDGLDSLVVGPSEKYEVVVPRPLTAGEAMCFGIWSKDDGKFLAFVHALDNVCSTDTVTFTPRRTET